MVIGSTCAGKTTLAKTLAQIRDLPHIELDALHWGSNWVPTPTSELRHTIKKEVAKEHWVIDGNYTKLREIIWPRVDTYVWLDYNLAVVLWRWLKRTSRRVFGRERLWNDNRETLKGAVFSSDSLLFWILKRFASRRREYMAVLTKSPYSLVTRVYLPNPSTTDNFCHSLRHITLE